jgi:predicted nucleic acid-binding protein
MEQGRVVDLDSSIALSAAKFGIEYRLPLADSVVLATARHHGAQVWTQDSDFKGLPDVRFTAK